MAQPINQTPYQVEGYENRKHYLECMADDYDIPLYQVRTLAQMLGPTEDFDGLVTMLQDIADANWS